MTLDASFVLVVTGAAMLWPPLALLVGGAYLGVLQLLAWREGGATAPAD